MHFSSWFLFSFSLTVFATRRTNEEIAQRLTEVISSCQFSSSSGPFSTISRKQFATTRLLKYDTSFDERLFSYIPHDEEDEEIFFPLEEEEEFDWVSRGAVTKQIYDQGSLGTCYAFATLGNVEGRRYLVGDGKLESLSVEQIVECSSEYEHDKAQCGVFGGWPKLTLEYIMKQGISTEKSWPYCSGTLNKRLIPLCFPCMPNGYSKELCDDHDDDFYCNPNGTKGQNPIRFQCKEKQELKVKTIKVLDDSSNEDILKEHLKYYGPLPVTITGGPLQLYFHGIFDAPDLICAKTGQPDHVALLVGYGTENGKKFWRLKNSWGEKWGEKGYFRIRRGKNVCGIGNFQIVTAIDIEIKEIKKAII